MGAPSRTTRSAPLKTTSIDASGPARGSIPGDSATALARFDQLPDSLCLECYADRLTRTRLLNAQRRHHEALAGTEEVPFEFLTALEVPMAIERARAAAAIGERKIADRALDWAARAWHRADPALRPLVEPARVRR